MATGVYEVVIFGLKENAHLQAFRDSLQEVDAFIRQQPGLIERTLLSEVDGKRWVDLVRWERVEDAVAAFEAFGKRFGGTLFEESIDQASVVALRASDRVNVAA